MDEFAKRLNRAHISARDFERAGDFIAAAGKHTPADIEYEGLLLSAVVYYARPFSNNVARADKNPRSDPNIDIDAKELLGDDHSLHERILHLRNKAVAHAEFDFYPVSPLSPDDAFNTGFVVTSQSWHIVSERIDLKAFARIAAAMNLKCRNIVVDLGLLRTRV